MLSEEAAAVSGGAGFFVAGKEFEFLRGGIGPPGGVSLCFCQEVGPVLRKQLRG